jgi:GMP synthase-like glutamine amidotransferase
MKIHWLQHVPFEGLGCIEPWLAENRRDVSCTRLWAGDDFPNLGNVDGLIVMGGPMGVCDEAEYPWLAAEKAFIKEIIAQDKPVLGICLGAQLIAETLGSKVWKNREKEIGFFPMVGKNPLMPEQFTAFHWHGDTFGIPDGAVHLASSEATENQAFLYQDNVLGLQFHLETTEESLLALYENAKDEITAAPFIQTWEEATALRLANGDLLDDANVLMKELLGNFFREESQLTNNE